METLLQQKEEKCSSNQEEGFINPKLLRLGSPIPTPPTPTDQESPIMFSDSCSMCGSKQRDDQKVIGDQKVILGDQKDCSPANLVKKSSMETQKEEDEYINQEEALFSDSCSMCGSKKRKLLKSSYGERKKMILIDPSSMKEAAAASSTDDERFPPIRHSSSFLHQIPNSSPPPQTSPFLNRSVSDISSFALSGSSSSPKSPSAAEVIPNQTSSPSNAAYSPQMQTSSFSSPNSPSSSSPSFHLPKSSTATPTPTPTDSIQTKDDQKPIGDQKDCSRGNCKVGVLAATTTTSTDHPKHEQIEEGNIKKVQFSCSCGEQTSSFSSPNSPSSSSPCFHLPKSSTATPPTDSIQKSDDQKPIGDQKSIGDQKDCSRGNCKVGVLAATTTTSTDHPKHEQIEEGNIKKVQFSCRKQTSPFSSPNSPSSSSPCFHTTTPTDSVQKSDDQKPIGDQNSIGDGNYEQMQILQWYIQVGVQDGAGINDLCLDLLNHLISYLSPRDAAKIPTLNKTILNTFELNPIRIDSRYAAIPTLNKILLEIWAQNPISIDGKLIQSLDPISLQIDDDRLERMFSLVPYNGREVRKVYFIESLLKAYKDMYRLHLSGSRKVITCVLAHRFRFLKSVSMFNVRVCSAKDFMLSSCLEELLLKNCQVPSYFKLKLQDGASLKTLDMDTCTGLTNGEITHIVLKIPSLLKFRFNGWVSLFDITEATKLAEVDIQFKGITRAQHMWGSDMVFKFLSSLKDVQKLKICNMCIKNARGTSLSNKLLFPNLKELTLAISLVEEDEVQDLVNILRSVPILDQLSIKVQNSWFISPGFWRSNPIRFYRLTCFNMEPFNGGKAGMDFIGYVLMNARVLKKAKVVLMYGVGCSSLSHRAQEKLLKAYGNARRVRDEILALPRASAEAEVIVLLDEAFIV